MLSENAIGISCEFRICSLTHITFRVAQFVVSVVEVFPRRSAPFFDSDSGLQIQRNLALTVVPAALHEHVIWFGLGHFGIENGSEITKNRLPKHRR